jgi:hypothetical protein
LQAPQRPLSARRSAGIRFFLPQEGQCRIIGKSIGRVIKNSRLRQKLRTFACQHEK